MGTVNHLQQFHVPFDAEQFVQSHKECPQDVPLLDALWKMVHPAVFWREELIAEIYSQKKAIQLGFENWQADVEYTVTLRIVSGGLYYETKLCTMLNGDVAPNVPSSVTE